MKSETAAKYLKVILRLREQNGEVKSAMVASEMYVTRPTVCVALQHLQKDGLIRFDETHEIQLTETGERIARKVTERYEFFLEFFTKLGLPERIAEKDACAMEFTLSDESYALLRSKISQ
jgi:Mn-dependent DtxR family transcriptional regulator